MADKSHSKLQVLFSGYSKMCNDKMEANCTCSLITGPQNCIIDTRTAWDGDDILNALKERNISPEDIHFVICTHGHSDHIGCNYLFKNATHIVGFSISHRESYFLKPDFSSGEEYVINKQIKVIPTPGHTFQDVTVLYTESGTVHAITGDLFENENDLDDDSIWKSAGSDSVELQEKNRGHILKIADFIIPGHGPMFKVPQKYK